MYRDSMSLVQKNKTTITLKLKQVAQHIVNNYTQT